MSWNVNLKNQRSRVCKNSDLLNHSFREFQLQRRRGRCSENRKPHTENLPEGRPHHRSFKTSLNRSLEMTLQRLGGANRTASTRAACRRTIVRDRGQFQLRSRKTLRNCPRSRSSLRLRSVPPSTAPPHTSLGLRSWNCPIRRRSRLGISIRRLNDGWFRVSDRCRMRK